MPNERPATETWTDAAPEDARTLVPDAPTTEESGQPERTSPSGEARTTVLPDIVTGGARPTLRGRSEPRFVSLGAAGEGGLGEVRVALDQDIGRKVAIKRIRADRLSSAAVVRFVQEIRTIGRLEHANIVPIHDVGRDDTGALYFVMRYVEGETLEAVIARLRAGDAATHRAWGFERRVQVIGQVLEALAFAHANGVIHRDLKPANIMIGRYGEAMLLDWGVAHAAGEGNGVTGSPAYMSPAQARGEAADARCDVYAISVVMHELLTLRHYLEDCTTVADTLRGVQERPVPLAGSVRNGVQTPVPMDLTWFVAKGVEKDPTKRYPSARAMLDRLAARAEGDIPIQCHVTFTQRASASVVKWMNRNGLLAAFLLVSVPVVTLGSLVVWVATR